MILRCKLLFFLLLATYLLIGCNSQQKRDLSIDGVEFNLPKGWKISSIDSSESDYGAVSLDPEVKDGTSFIFVEWGKGLVELEKQIAHVQSGYLEHPDLQDADFTFSKAETIDFAGKNALRSTFTFHISGIEQEGVLYCLQFPDCDKTVSLVMQAAKEDKSKLENAVKDLNNSLICQKN